MSVLWTHNLFWMLTFFVVGSPLRDRKTRSRIYVDNETKVSIVVRTSTQSRTTFQTLKMLGSIEASVRFLPQPSGGLKNPKRTPSKPCTDICSLFRIPFMNTVTRWDFRTVLLDVDRTCVNNEFKHDNIVEHRRHRTGCFGRAVEQSMMS